MKKNINIAFIGYFFCTGGVPRSLLSIAETLKGRGFSFHMINLFCDDFQDRFRACGPCHYIPDPQKVISYLKNNNIDIVHTNNCDAGSYLGYIANVPRIIERLDGCGSAFIFDKTPVDCIIASTDLSYKKAVDTYTHKYVQKIYNGVNTSIFCQKPKDEKLACQLGISKDDIVIGYLARISREKRQDMFLDIFKTLVKTLPKLKLILIGNDHDDGYRTIVQDKIKQLGLTQHVTMLNARENPEQILTLFDIGINYSGTYIKNGTITQCNEGFSNALMEQMSMGIPIVATDSGENPSLVQDGWNGFIVNMNDSEAFHDRIIELATQKNLRKKFGNNAIKKISDTFSLNRMADEYARLYEYVFSDKFIKNYPKSRYGISSCFMRQQYSFPNKPLKNKKILIVKSGNNQIFHSTINRINQHFIDPQVSLICQEQNIKDVLQYKIISDIHAYNKSDLFDKDLMGDIISHINAQEIDFIFFIFNYFSGIKDSDEKSFFKSLKLMKQSDNIIDLINELNATHKIAVTHTFELFPWLR